MGILEDIAAEREARNDDRTIPENAFEISVHSPIDGSKKYSFDTIY